MPRQAALVNSSLGRERRRHELVGVNDQSACDNRKQHHWFAKHTASCELAPAQFFVTPEHVALRMVAFGEQSIGQAHGLNRFTIKHGPHFDTGLFLELGENGFLIDLVLCAVNHD